MPVAGPFFFAYVMDDTVAFDPVTHAVMDEYIFEWYRILSEVDKPVLELVMQNPHVGALSATRDKWAWLSWTNPANNQVEPLFRGRVVANPDNVIAEVITLRFVSWPSDYFKQQQQLAETLKQPPYWDEVMIAVDKADDPNTILEARSELFCVDPITLVVTAEDILDSSDGNVDLTSDDFFYDSLDMHDGDAPLTAVLIDASVSWMQTARGLIDMGANVIFTYSGDGFISEWPKPLAQLGGGWSVQDGFAQDALHIAQALTGSARYTWTNTARTHNDGDSLSLNISVTLPRLAGAYLQYTLTSRVQSGVLDPFAVDGDGDPAPLNIPQSSDQTFVYCPLWTINTSLVLRYDLARQRTERVLILLQADLQAIINDPLVTQNTETIKITGRDVGVPIIDLLNWTTVADTDVEVDQVIFPDDPTLPGGRSAQICVVPGHTGTVEPEFSDIPGTITVDNTAQWSSLGDQKPTEGAQDWFAVTNVPPGTIILPRLPLWTTWAIAARPGLAQFPAIGFSASLGQIVQGSNGFYFSCTLDGLTLTVEPSWSSSYGSVVTDGGAQWTCIGNILPDGKTHYITPNGGLTGALYVTPQFGAHTARHDQVSDNGVTWISIGPGLIPAGGTSGNVWARSYFPSDNGKRSLEYMMAIGRAHIRKRARAVEIEFECSFELGVNITCRKTVTLHDTRIPGGVALGKVTRAVLSANGDTGEVKCHVTIGCAVGRGNAVTTVPGTPVYASAGYMQTGYQQEVDGILVLPDLTDVGYTPIVSAPNDDGLVLPLTKAQVVISEGVKGSVTAQAIAIMSAFADMARAAQLGQLTIGSIGQSILVQQQQIALDANSPARAMARNPIYYEAQLKPVVNGPFWDVYRVTTQMMTVPMGIDLEGGVDGGGVGVGGSIIVGIGNSSGVGGGDGAGGGGGVVVGVGSSSGVGSGTGSGSGSGVIVGVGSSHGVGSSSGVGVGGGAFTNTETNNLAANIVPTPSTPWLTAVDTLITSLKSAPSGNIWSTFDLFHCYAAENASSRTFNWVNNAVGLLTAHGTINAVSSKYAASDGLTGYYSSTFNVNSAHATDGNAEFGYFCLSEDSVDAVSPFQCSGGKHTFGMQSSSTGNAINSINGQLNTSTAASFNSLWGSTVGHFVLQQNTTTQLQAFLDGASLGTSTQIHSVDSGTVQIFKTGGGAFTTRKIAFTHYGSKLTSAQHHDLSKALYTFLTTLNVRAMSGYLGGSTGPTNIAPYKRLPTGTGNNLRFPCASPNINNGLLQAHAAAYGYNAIVVNDPNYLNLVRLEVHHGDNAPFDGGTIDRVQFNCFNDMSFAMGSTIDVSYSMWIETGSSNDASFLDIIDLHGQSGGVNPFAHALDNTGKFWTWIYHVPTNTKNWSSFETCSQGAWHHVRTTMRLGTSGFCQTWFDGVKIFDFTGDVGGGDTGPFWWNLALYRGSNADGLPMAVWFANIELDASGTQPFASRVASPLPVPPLT